MTVSYPYYNEAGEPLMDGAAMRYEMYLDSTYEPDPDDFYNSYEDDEQADPSTCPHTDNWSSYERGGVTVVECDDCWTEGTVKSWDEDGWIDDIQWEVAE